MRLPFALLLVLNTTLPGQPATDAGDPPNVLLIVADDQGFADLSCSGLADDVDTPHIDRLASSGLRFTHAYAAAPICNASRVALQTGVYPQRFGTFWYGGRGIHDPAHPTLAECLRDRGLRTHYVGKFHHGGRRADRPGSRSFPLEHGFESLYGFAGGRKHYLHHSAAREAAFRAALERSGRRGQSLQQGPFRVGVEQVDQDGFSTDLLADRAGDILRAAADDEQPFFLQLAFNAVHNFTHQLPPSYLAEHDLHGLDDWDPEREDYFDWYRRGRRPNNPEGRALYLGQLHFLDRAVGRVLDELARLGLRDDTLIVYVGDNGGSTPIYADNGPLRGSKYTLYEGGLRVPLLVSWPGHVAAGEVSDAVVSQLDLLPTLCALAGASPPEILDGVDLSAHLADPEVPVAERVLHWDNGHQWAVRDAGWKLVDVEHDRFARREMVEVDVGTALFDLRADPGESQDRAAEQPERVARLRAAHTAWRSAVTGR